MIWISAAEGALPRGRAVAAASDEDDGKPAKTGPALVAAYVKAPSQDTVVVFDCSRYDFDGDDKARIDRVQKFYSAVPNLVEFRPLGCRRGDRAGAQAWRRSRGLQIGIAEIALLVDALGADGVADRIGDREAESVCGHGPTRHGSGYREPGTECSREHDFRVGIGVGRRQPGAIAEVLDALVREGEYLPLALSFLATQFRSGAGGSGGGGADAPAKFRRTSGGLGFGCGGIVRSRSGRPCRRFRKRSWRRRCGDSSQADRGLRDARPDDRIVMEELILTLTG